MSRELPDFDRIAEANERLKDVASRTPLVEVLRGWGVGVVLVVSGGNISLSMLRAALGSN